MRATAMLAAMFLLGGAAAAQERGLSVELNKFETAETGACRAYFLFRNGTGQTFDGFELSIAVLNRDGVIDRLLAVDASPLPVARTTLKLFEIPDIACADISELIVHDIPVCKPANAEPADCFGLIDWASRTGARLGP